MSASIKAFVALRGKQRGLTTVEYAVAGGILVAGIIAAFLLLGTNVTAIINDIAGGL